MEKSTKVLGAAGAVAAAAVGVGMAVKRRGGGPPEVYHVRPASDGWAVAKEGGDRPSSTHGTKKEAMSAARKLAGNHAPSTLVLHYADGREQKKISYSVD